jgi:DNA-directed RNA polymerase specialized sigma24 family protein
MHNMNDSTIWEKFKKGDKEALSTIYHKHIDLLFSYGMKLYRDDELVKDTIQDLFFDLMRTRRNLGATDNIRFYLTKALRRRLIQNLNKLKKHFYIFGESEFETEVVFSVEEDLITREDLSIKERLIPRRIKRTQPDTAGDPFLPFLL